MIRIRLTFLLACLISLPAFSQRETPETGLGKGSWMIGGTAWFTEHASFNNIEYSIDPWAGYFLSENLLSVLMAPTILMEWRIFKEEVLDLLRDTIF